MDLNDKRALDNLKINGKYDAVKDLWNMKSVN